ncbi:MAG: hypothetical protein V3U37_04165 [Nitrospinaceae bacterium]
MFTVYKTASDEDICRIIDYCRTHTIKNGGLFEVYPGPDGDMHMVIVNSCPEDGPVDTFRPLGAFYCNYTGPGVIALEEEDPHFDGAENRKRHVEAVKQVIDILLKEARPGTKIRFNDLPALKD